MFYMGKPPTRPPLLFAGLCFLSKLVFSALLHNAGFSSICSSSLCQQVPLSSRNMYFCGNVHFTWRAKRYWKVKSCVVWSVVGGIGPLTAGSRFAISCLQHLPFLRVPQVSGRAGRDGGQLPQAKFIAVTSYTETIPRRKAKVLVEARKEI